MYDFLHNFIYVLIILMSIINSIIRAILYHITSIHRKGIILFNGLNGNLIYMMNIN
jgi:hypothetical protein